jgi:hypothetical protein
MSIAFLGVFWLRNVQPKRDELLNLQIEKMKRKIQVLEKQFDRARQDLNV